LEARSSEALERPFEEPDEAFEEEPPRFDDERAVAPCRGAVGFAVTRAGE